MANCCICGNRFSMFGEDTFNLTEEHVACYKCAQYIRSINNADAQETVKKYSDLLMGRINAQTDYKTKELVQGLVHNKLRALEAEKEAKGQQRDAVTEYHADYWDKYKQLLLTTGFSFDGYRIVEYKKIVTGEIVLGVGYFNDMFAGLSGITGEKSEALASKMREAKEDALEELKKQTIFSGGNAVIGVDFDYITYANSMLGVAVSGTSVVIERM